MSELRGKPYNPTLDVEALPRRVAHAVHALLEASEATSGNGVGPYTAAEVCVYDGEAISVKATAAALREAQKLGLAINWGGYWSSTFLSSEFRLAFETRYLRETGDGEE